MPFSRKPPAVIRRMTTAAVSRNECSSGQSQLCDLLQHQLTLFCISGTVLTVESWNSLMLLSRLSSSGLSLDGRLSDMALSMPTPLCARRLRHTAISHSARCYSGVVYPSPPPLSVLDVIGALPPSFLTLLLSPLREIGIDVNGEIYNPLWTHRSLERMVRGRCP